jgi:class 3 adenylate cyclase/tetratricopeptide (TPR) repeat protein
MSDIRAWLTTIGLDRYSAAFEASDIDLDVLADLGADDLRELGVSLGDSKRIQRAVAARAAERTSPHEDVAAPAAERRRLTVVFCDLVGSSALSERLDPEDLRIVYDRYYHRCDEAARRYGGHLAKVIGDGVNLYFGYPDALERSALSAVRAALDIVDGIPEMNDELGSGVPELSLRIGVHTGLAVAGAIGGADHELVGEMPVVASRIESVAKPGTVVVSDSTAQLVERDIVLDDLGPHLLKGLSVPVRLFAASRPERGVAVFDDRDETTSDLVGREEEINRLHARWAHARSERGQVVILAGDAGIGKSKLARSLAATAAGEPQLLSLQCSPYHTATALWPVIEQLTRAAGFQPGDSVEVRMARLDALLATIETPDLRSGSVAIVAGLLGVAHGLPAPPGSAEQLREHTLGLLASYFDALCRNHPAIVVVEDLHWCDPTTLELIGMLIERTANLRVLLLLTCRTEFTPPWSQGPDLTTMQLGRLSDTEVRAIIDRVARRKALPRAVVERILSRTDGVPLFVEELTRTVLESDVLVDEGRSYELSDSLLDAAIPSTLHDSLATRLDRLGPVREVAQMASAIGREFTVELLVHATGMGRDELAPALDTLQRSGLIQRADVAAGDAFMFKHALVRDAAYESMLRSRRRELHARLARALAADGAAVRPELLARHLDHAGLVEEAFDAYMNAGDQATAQSNHYESLSHFRRALELVKAQPASRRRTERELNVHNSLRNVLVVVHGYSAPEIEQACTEARALCEQLGDTEQLFPVLWNLVGFHMVRSDHEICEGINTRLAEIAEASGQRQLAMMAHDTIGQTRYYQGRYNDAVRHFEQVRVLYDVATDSGLAARFAEEDPCAAALGYGAVALWALGRRTEAGTRMAEAVSLLGTISFAATDALVMSLVVHLAYFRRDLDAARAAATNLLHLAEDNGFGYFVPAAHVQLGWVRAIADHDPAGVDLMRSGIDGHDRMGALVEQPFQAVLLADGLQHLGRHAEAVDVLDAILPTLIPHDERGMECELLRLRSQSNAACAASADTVERDLVDAMSLAGEFGAHSLLLRAATALAVVRRDRGESFDDATLTRTIRAIDGDLHLFDVAAARTFLP